MPTYTILQRYLYRGNKTWYGRINDGGKISYCTLKTKRKADAQAWLDSKNAARFFPELAARQSDENRHDIGKLFNDFIAHKESTLVGTMSSVRYNTMSRNILQWCEENGVRFVEDVSAGVAQDFANFMAKKFQPVTVRQYIMVFRTCLKYGIRKFSLERVNPFTGVEQPKLVKRAKEFWTPEEIDRILDNAPTPALRLEWSLMAFAGLRRSEAYGLKPEDINDNFIHVVGKGNKEAFVPIAERLKEEIERAGGIIHDDLSMTKKEAFLKYAAKSAGVSGTKRNPHKFRHSFVSNLLRAGIGDKFVSDLARHSQISTTLNVYGHLTKEDLKKAVDALK